MCHGQGKSIERVEEARVQGHRLRQGKGLPDLSGTRQVRLCDNESPILSQRCLHRKMLRIEEAIRSAPTSDSIGRKETAAILQDQGGSVDSI